MQEHNQQQREWGDAQQAQALGHREVAVAVLPIASGGENTFNGLLGSPQTSAEPGMVLYRLNSFFPRSPARTQEGEFMVSLAGLVDDGLSVVVKIVRSCEIESQEENRQAKHSQANQPDAPQEEQKHQSRDSCREHPGAGAAQKQKRGTDKDDECGVAALLQ